MTVLPNSLQARDIAYQIHPYTNLRQHENTGPLIIEPRRRASMSTTSAARNISRACPGSGASASASARSAWSQAAAEQMRKLPYYHTFTHKAHEPSIRLAEKLVEMTPESLTASSSPRRARRPTTPSSR